MRILAIDTSCDETAAAVTENTKILSNIVWSQASLHAKFGGVMPSLAQRMHEERIDWVINRAMLNAKCLPAQAGQMPNIDAIAVTVGPGLAIALGVGITKARGLARLYKKPLIPINHVEAHLLSAFANSEYLVSSIQYPVFGLVLSGGTTLLTLINKIGNYQILAETVDDALGEALDKAARLLGLGYPGGAILEKFAKLGNPKKYKLPIPIVGHEDRKIFTYSGLKTAMYRLVESEKLKVKSGLTKEQIINLAACFQVVAFEHLTRVIKFIIQNLEFRISGLLVGGGVSANNELRKRLRKLGKEFGIKILFPYTKKLCGDNAAMIGVAAFFKAQRGEFIEVEKIDRVPRAKIDTNFV